MIVYDFEQYSPEYWAKKIGKPSAGSFDCIVTSTGQNSTSWKSYAYKLAGELETGKPAETHQSEWMTRGLEIEDEARGAFGLINDVDVYPAGLVFKDEAESVLCSPDGFFKGEDGLLHGLEIKCPSPGVHAQYRHERKLPTKYAHQVWGSLWICDEVESWFFFSYHPDMAPFQIEVTRQTLDYIAYAQKLDTAIPEFLEKLKGIK